MNEINSTATTLEDDATFGLGEINLFSSPDTFSITPASLISIEGIGGHRELLSGAGIDWGSGGGCLYAWDYEAADYTLAPGPDYCDGGMVVNRSYPATEVALHVDIEDQPVIHERIWPLGHVINALIKAGLVLRHFQEVADGWTPFENMSLEILRRLPHGYMLIADKSPHAK